MYNSQRDKMLSTSKKEVKNSGTCNQPNSKKIGPKNAQSKLVVKIGFGNKVFNRGNSINQFRYGKFSFGNILVKF